jgi:hypothetical protein
MANKPSVIPFILNCRRIPARLNPEQVAALLGIQKHDVPTLIKAKVLKPLGKPACNSVKYFSTEEILEDSRERRWLSKMTDALSSDWSERNARKKR